MNWKIIGYIGTVLLVIVLTGALGWKIIGKTEGYRAEEQNFYSLDYHPFIGGCARYDAYKKPDLKPELKKDLKQKEVKK